MTNMSKSTDKEQEKLMEVLKFTPRTYKIQLWGYGGEYIMGTVDRKIYDYFRARRLDLSDFAWSSDYADEHNIPEEMWPFSPGSYYDCDDMGHIHGVDRNAGTLQITDEQDQVIYERRLEDITGGNEDEPEWGSGEEVWIGMKPEGTVVFLGVSNEKGTFFEGEIALRAPFDITKLTLGYDEFDGNDIVNTVEYDGEEIENWGGDTSGKSSEFGFYLVKNSNTWEKYTNMDDITYAMTDWFPKKIKPVRAGVYMIRTAGKNSYTYQCKWTGSKWVSGWTEAADYKTAEEVKIKEWQGLAADPDADVVWDPAAELDKIVADFTFEQGIEALENALNELGKEIGAEQPVACFSCGEEHFESELPELDGQLHCPDCHEGWVMMDQREEAEETTQAQTGWPFAGPATTENAVTTEIKSKWWKIRTYHKKNCEQQEYFIQREGNGRIKVTDGFRWCEYNVETNDGEFPKFEFTQVPGGNGAFDSLDMNSLYGSNIESSELVSMDDGGCWGGWEIEGVSEEEEEQLNEFLEENGSWALEDEGEWYLDETEVWV